MKKSYMNNENILTEGFFDKIKRMMGLSSSDQKKIKKETDKKLNSIIKDLNSSVRDFEKHAAGMYKDLGIKKKVNIRKYKLTDFL